MTQLNLTAFLGINKVQTSIMIIVCALATPIKAHGFKAYIQFTYRQSWFVTEFSIQIHNFILINLDLRIIWILNVDICCFFLV